MKVRDSARLVYKKAENFCYTRELYFCIRSCSYIVAIDIEFDSGEMKALKEPVLTN